jgi:hypothetical protein
MRFHVSRLTSHASRFLSPRLVAFFLFLAALFLRLPGLGLFLTSDENTNIFFAGSDVIAAFLRGDLRGTYWHFYPGVTMSWLDAMGMAGQYFIDILTGQSVPPFTEYIYGDILSLLVANRLPYVILTAAAVPATYLLARKLLPERVALLGALFIAFDPFYLAHSRVAHGDAPLAVFMLLSTLTFFIYLKRVKELTTRRNKLSDKRNQRSLFLPASSFILHPSSFYLISSAVFGSLAALTKAPGQFMALFVVGMALLHAARDLWRVIDRSSPDTQVDRDGRVDQYSRAAIRHTYHVSRIILRWLTVIIIWGLISLIFFILLWPSMWVDPIGTIRQMLDETFGKVEEGHLVYFLGRSTLNPGFWFYFYVIPFRLTPIALMGSLLSLLMFIPGLSPNWPSSTRRAFFYLWLFTITLLLFGTLSPKKQDRYLLPLFPFLDLLTAIGWVGVFDLIYHLLKSHFLNRNSIKNLSLISNFSLLIILSLHLTPVFTYYPYYLTYFNPLLGGPTRAAETTLVGWGEGMEQVAAYLNTKPNAENLYVASTPSQTLLPYFTGTGENFYTNDIVFRADYVVLYLAQMQRLAPSPEIVRYFESQKPEKIITIKGVIYAKIYPGHKLILPDIPPDATPINIGLDDAIRLAGYKTQDSELTLYWHALTPLTINYTVSVRARAADGRLITQQDSWPVDGLLPTSQWRQGDYVTDTHTLDMSDFDVEQIDKFEVIVYNSETGETLGPPIILPMNNE